MLYDVCILSNSYKFIMNKKKLLMLASKRNYTLETHSFYNTINFINININVKFIYYI